MSISVGQSLREAVREFQDALTPEQNKDLQMIKAVPDAAAVITFTAQLDEKNAQRRTRCVASRLYTLLQSVQQFSTIVDTFVSSRPNIAALVWGSIKLTLLVASNITSYFDALSALFMSFNKLCPRFAEYQILYPQSPRLQASLWPSQVLNALCRSFQTEFEPFTAEIRRCSKDVEKEISLAKAQADYQDQQLQFREREAASRGRKSLQSFISKSTKENEESRQWRIQQEERNARKHRLRLLDSLTTYNHLVAFKQARKQRHGNTALWLSQSREYKRWVNDAGASVLWCSGKLGSGKTVLTANVVDNLFLNRTEKDIDIGFFFCRFDEAVSLKAELILRSIIRQSLDATNLPSDIEPSLEDLSQNALSGIEELRNLLQKKAALSRAYYIVIDALDECERSERDVVFDVLQSVIAPNVSKVKLFLSSRDSISEEIKKRFPYLHHLSMGSPEALSDIMAYTKEAIDGRLSNGALVVGNSQLVNEIKDALIQGSQGMFLWVAFQIDEICSQRSDEDIRQALRNLPKDLTETFNRALSRVLTKGNATIAKQVFRWVAAVKRPLSLEELREAIAIEPGQPYSKPERLVNGMNRVTAWCENLIVLDEEEEVVQFAHHTVQQYLLGTPRKKRLRTFHFPLQDADHEVGEICVTYLNLNDFKTQLMRQPKSQPAITPGAIVETALGHRVKSTGARLFIQSVVSRRRQKATKIDVLQQLSSYSGSSNVDFAEKLLLQHPFLGYASENWLLHTTSFERSKSTTWSLWTQMVLDEQSLGQVPWTHEEFVERDRRVVKWICDQHHSALLRLIESSDRSFSSEDRTYLISCISTKDDRMFLEFFLEAMQPSTFEINSLLQEAAGSGHLEDVNRLLAANADVNAASGPNGLTALAAAAEGGHLEVVNRLLTVKVDVNAALESSGLTILTAAAKRGHLEVVNRLLAAKANVNTASGPNGLTALTVAAEEGHLEVVNRLLTAMVKVNDVSKVYVRDALAAAAGRGRLQVVNRLLAVNTDVNTAAIKHEGRIALQAATEEGHLEVLNKFLAVNADINAASSRYKGRTALQAAAEGGHLEVVNRLLTVQTDDVNAALRLNNLTALTAAAGKGHLEVVNRLLTAKADINCATAIKDNCATAIKDNGGTPLQVAAERGHLEIVNRLLAVKADINAAAESYGRTALQAAAEGGHLKVVNRLLAEKADVNAAAAKYNGRTALQAAAEMGHLEVVDRLLAEKADVNAAAAESYGRTALHAAAEGGHLEVVNRLLAVDADVNAAVSEYDGRSALQAAAEEGHLKIVDRLLAAKANVNAAAGEVRGRTALQAAAEKGHLEIANRLLAVNANVNAAAGEFHGRTALQAAIEGGHTEIEARLRSAGAKK